MDERKLLIVESPGNKSERFRRLARYAGFKVMTTNSGPMVRSVARRDQPDLVLVSPLNGTPGSSEIARIIKEDPETKDIPVMILLGGSRLEEIFDRVYPTEACTTADASDDELLSTMRMLTSGRRRLRYGSKPLQAMEGDLADDTFPEVLQFLFAARKTGRITVMNGTRYPGRIYIENGDVVHAEYADQSGLDPFRRMCFATNGRFKFEPDERTAHRSMQVRGMDLLLEAARRKDDSERKPRRRTSSRGGGRAERREDYRAARGSSLSVIEGLGSEKTDAGRPPRARWARRALVVLLLLAVGVIGAVTVLRGLRGWNASAPGAHSESVSPAEADLLSPPEN